jgi:hypothetical protein
MGSTLVRTTVSFPSRLMVSRATKQILASADRGYRILADEGLPRSVEAARRHDFGDLLADFIVEEIWEVAEGSAQPWHEAVRAIERAMDQLEAVATQLRRDAPEEGA